MDKLRGKTAQGPITAAGSFVMTAGRGELALLPRSAPALVIQHQGVSSQTPHT